MKVWKMIFFFSWVIFRFHVIKILFCFQIQMLIRLVVVFNGQDGMWKQQEAWLISMWMISM